MEKYICEQEDIENNGDYMKKAILKITSYSKSL
jgi:hypothetical protein